MSVKQSGAQFGGTPAKARTVIIPPGAMGVVCSLATGLKPPLTVTRDSGDNTITFASEGNRITASISSSLSGGASLSAIAKALSQADGAFVGIPVTLTGFSDAPAILPFNYRLILVGDSQFAGRGAGTGAVQMDGARVLNIASELAAALSLAGIPAESNTFVSANNQGGSPTLYDPRIGPSTFTIPTTGKNFGGVPFSGGSGQSMTMTLPVCDSIEIGYPTNSTIASTLSYSIDGGDTVDLVQNTAASFQTTTASVPHGAHTITFTRKTGSTSAVFVQYVDCWDSTVNAVRISNFSARGFSTADWLTNDLPYRARGSLTKYIQTCVARGEKVYVLWGLGTNDRTTANAGLSSATYSANYQTLISDCAAAGAINQMLAMPQPINPAEPVSFSEATMLSTLQTLATSNRLPSVFRTDTVLAPWSAEQTADNLHWLAAGHSTEADALLAPVASMMGLPA